MKIAIIGGGASGFFAAIQCASLFPTHSIFIFEKNNKCLAKVKISGGGRCNVTNKDFSSNKLSYYYPRGFNFLKKVFKIFNHEDTVNWFAKQNVNLKTETDGRLFPSTNDSQTIIDCLLGLTYRLGINVVTSVGVIGVEKIAEQKFRISFSNRPSDTFDRVLLASGGIPNMSGFQWLKELGLKIVKPVPSLFTFNIPTDNLKDLQGLSVQNAVIKIVGTDYIEKGILLNTHWGFSGPAIIRLSAMAALKLNELDYNFQIHINWAGGLKENELRSILSQYKNQNSKRFVATHPMFDLPKRLWEKIAEVATIIPDTRWNEISNKQLNKLIETLQNHIFKISGKTTFKDEFVTAGGISLDEVNAETMESVQHKGLYFSGEILDIDGITGGYNFQAAWSTGYLAGSNMGLE